MEHPLEGSRWMPSAPSSSSSVSSSRSPATKGLETDLLYLACLAALVLGGSGPLAIDGLWAKRRGVASVPDGQPQWERSPTGDWRSAGQIDGKVAPNGDRRCRKFAARISMIDESVHHWTLRKPRMAAAIAALCVSNAKWPGSKKRTSAFGMSRLNASAPAGRKNGSFLPHTARSGGW